MRETQVEQALTRQVEQRGGLCWKFVSPGLAGVPDRIVLLPESVVGFVEVKRPGGRPRKLQQYRLQQLTNLGIPTATVDHPSQIGGVLDAFQTAHISD